MQNMVVYKRVCLVYSRSFCLFIYLFLTYSRKYAKLIVNEGEYCRATPFMVTSCFTISFFLYTFFLTRSAKKSIINV